MCLKVRTSFAANSGVAVVVTGAAGVLQHHNNTHFIIETAALDHPPPHCRVCGSWCRMQAPVFTSLTPLTPLTPAVSQ